MEEKGIDVVLVSDSRLLTDGLGKILVSEDAIERVSVASELEEIRAIMDVSEPQYILYDQRIKRPGIEKYLRSRQFASTKTELILLSDEEDAGDGSGKHLQIGHHTSARELIDLLTDTEKYREKIKRSKKLAEDKNRYVTKTESRIIDLISSGHSNKEIADKLRVSEKTIKAHITNIFSKLDIQNRYQLMVYGQKTANRH